MFKVYISSDNGFGINNFGFVKFRIEIRSILDCFHFQIINFDFD